MHFQSFKVRPAFPEPLLFLDEISRNLWWTWNYDAVELFRRINPKLWKEARRNPLAFLTSIPRSRYQELARNESFIGHPQGVKEHYEQDLKRPGPGASGNAPGDAPGIAYFSMEFGVHESLPLFAGGLGILAGDHLKSASCIGLDLVGVGLLYREGYFRQYLNGDGWQQEGYPENDIFHLPVRRARDGDDKELIIEIDGPDGRIRARVWKVMVGRIPLFLLDSDMPENPGAIRDITARLYAGNPDSRLAQEVLLGVGGMKALAAMGIFPEVCHMNEGHSAFASLERLARTMERFQVDVRTAMEIVRRTTVFTTHTPVAAGHDEFPAEKVKPYVQSLAKRLTLTGDEVVALGQSPDGGGNSSLSMFVLALRMARYCNGVSTLHGRVARRMWAYVWPERPEDEIPITHITNGVHISSYISREKFRLLERYMGPEWDRHPVSREGVERIRDIFDEELWNAHEISRSRLIRACRKRLVEQYERRGAPRSIMDMAKSVLDQNVLTICFARRFAAYKRAALLLEDPERLVRMITSDVHPVQFVFAGKAHPKDDVGKKLISRVVAFAKRKSVRHRFIFIEDYDIDIARYMTQGGDVWLNTPRRPFEACGTSGMKAAVNGLLNVSTLDGWWCEGCTEETGWRIGAGEEYKEKDYAEQDAVESQALYNVLENDVIPLFYKSGYRNPPPRRWLAMMKASMKMAIRDFSSHRMVMEYNDAFYTPVRNRMRSLVAENAMEAKNLANLHQRLRERWPLIRLEPPVLESAGRFRVGDDLKMTCMVYLGELQPDEVDVELYHGRLSPRDVITDSATELMRLQKECVDGGCLYECVVSCADAGRHAYTARATPHGDVFKNIPGFLTWAKETKKESDL